MEASNINLNLGIIGVGFVGSAILEYFNKLKLNCSYYDKHKNLGTFESILKTDILYICLPTNYDSSKKEYNMMEIDSTLEQLCIN